MIDRNEQRLSLVRILDKRDKSRNIIGLYKCKCGNDKELPVCRVKGNKIKSCGCLNRDVNREKATKHNMSNIPEYDIWTGIKYRCCNPNSEDYKDYGGRGIAVCDRWMDSFENFYNDMGKRPSKKYSIHRLKNDEGYNPDNCVWATSEQQTNEKGNNHLLTYDGRTQSMSRWSKELNIPYRLLQTRINKLDWDITRALETTVKKGKVITYNGKSQTVSEWAKELNMPSHIIRGRINMGWDLAKTFITPIIKDIPRDYKGQFSYD